MANKNTSLNCSFVRDLRRFGVEALCLLMLLYGAPLQALDSVTEPQRTDAAAESNTTDDPSWVEPFLETAGHSLDAVQDEVRQLAVDLASQPWPDAFGLLFKATNIGAASGSSAPPSPPKDGARPSKDYDLASLAAGFSDKNALDAVPLLPGWNQVSLPEIPTSSDPATALNAIGGSYHKVYAYNGCDAADPWKIYDPNDLAASDLTTIGVEQGILIDATAAVNLPSDGTLPDSTTIQLCTGWNLIGFPSAYPRHVKSALAPILDKVVRVYAFDPFDLADNWKFYEASAPAWASDLDTMLPGKGYWVLVTEDVQLEIKNVGDAPSIAFSSPQDLDVVTAPTEIQGTVASDLLDNWQLRYRGVGENDWVELANGDYPVQGKLGDFDPTLLLNGMYELELVATDLQGQQVTDSIAIVVEGNMKIGHFTLSFVDLAIPLSGLDIQVVRTYDSRQRHLQGDFGFGWTLDIRQGSYRNNRPPGDGWRIPPTEGPWGLPCSTVQELKSHLTTVRLSDQEVYRFRLTVKSPGTIIGGCIGRAEFEFVDGPVPGATLEILGNDEVLYQNNSDELRDPNSFALFVPEDVKLTTRDGRIFHLDLTDGVTHLEDLNGNTLEITLEGIAHSSGRGVEFERDAEGRIERIVDPMGNANVYAYDEAGDHVSFTDRMGAVTTFAYADGHYLEDIVNALGVRAVRTEYDDEGRMVRVIDAAGKVTSFEHDLSASKEVITNRLGFTQIHEYDSRGNVIRQTDELGRVTARTFDDHDNLLSETDPLGRVTRYAYAPSNQLEKVIDPLGNETVYTLNDRLQVLTVTDPRGGLTRNTYDGRGNLLSSTDPLGQTTSSTFDAAGNLIRSTDALGHVTRYEYDARGYPTKVIDPLGSETLFDYDANGNQLVERRFRTPVDGSLETLVTSRTYDALGRETSKTTADGGTTTVVYDVLGNVTQSTDALGRQTTMSHNLQGLLVRSTTPDGTSRAQTYDAEGRLTTRTDRAGRTTAYSHDPVGSLTSLRLPDGAVVTRIYNAAGQLIELTDAMGNSTTFAYDAAGRRISMTDALGQSSQLVYDATGNRIAATDPMGNTVAWIYDALHRPTKEIYPDGTSTALTYDALGRRTSSTDASGIETTFTYDAVGRLLAVTDALDQITAYAYDEVGNRIRQIDALGRVTRFELDEMGRRTARILPDDSRETRSFHLDGTLASHSNFQGTVSTYAYDTAGRLTLQTFPDGSTRTFTYTPTGRRATVTDGRGTTSYSYDNRDRLLEKVDPTGNKLSYSYDLNGNRTTLTATAGATTLSTSYTQDALNRITSLTDPTGGITTAAYDPNGNLVSLAYPNSVTTDFAFDSLSQLTGLTTSNALDEVLQSYRYALGPTGQRLAIEEADGTTRQYQYDALYRLTEDHVTDAAQTLVYQRSFSYDPVGNRMSQSLEEGVGPATTNSTFDSRDRLLTAGGRTHTWTVEGNLSSRSGENAMSLDWDFENRLRSVTLDDGTVIEHAYDVDGHRVRSTITPSGEPPSVIDYLVDTSDPLSHVVVEIVDGQAQAHYSRLEDQLVHVFRPGTGENRYFHSDGLGSIRLLSDQAGTPTDHYSYSAFGELLDHTGSDSQPYGFAGEPSDPTTGFGAHRARWLDTDAGRFLSMDPFSGFSERPISLHKYLYANADPVNVTDPTGLFGLSTTMGGLAASGNLRGMSSSVYGKIFFAATAVIGGVIVGDLLRPDPILSSTLDRFRGDGQGYWGPEIEDLHASGAIADTWALMWAELLKFREEHRGKDPWGFTHNIEIQVPSGWYHEPKMDIYSRRIGRYKITVAKGGRAGRVFQVSYGLGGKPKNDRLFIFRMDWLDHRDKEKGPYLGIHCHLRFLPLYESRKTHRSCNPPFLPIE